MSVFFHPPPILSLRLFKNINVRIRAWLLANLFAHTRLYPVVSDPAEVKIGYIESVLSQVRKP